MVSIGFFIVSYITGRTIGLPKIDMEANSSINWGTIGAKMVERSRLISFSALLSNYQKAFEQIG